MRTIKTYKPELKSLLQRLIDNGCEIVSGSNGGDYFKAKGVPADEFLEELLGADEAWLKVNTPIVCAAIRVLYLVYGNEPGVIVCDHHVDDVLDKVVDEHHTEWSKKEQPTIEVE